MDQNTPVKAPGTTILKVVGILMIIFGAISLIVGLAGGALAGVISTVEDETAGEIAGTLAGYSTVVIITSVIEFVAGIVGVALCKKPAKATVCIVFGCLTVIAACVSFVMGIVGDASVSNIVSGLVGFVLPVLYLIGAFKNKKA